MPTPHIESQSNEIADIVLMPGDPKRAEYIAKKYLENPQLVNQVRGITAYTGTYKNKKITIFPSGMGVPSIGIYSYELFKFYNVQNIIRIGTCGAYVPDLNLKDLILVESSFSQSTYAKLQNGNSKNYLTSSPDLNQKVIETAKTQNINLKTGTIYCSDVFYEENSNYQELVNNYNVLGVEMETFGLFHNANALNKKATAIVAVTDSFCKEGILSSEERQTALDDMFILALETCLKL